MLVAVHRDSFIAMKEKNIGAGGMGFDQTLSLLFQSEVIKMAAVAQRLIMIFRTQWLNGLCFMLC